MRSVLQQQGWSGSRLDVAARLMSRVIVAHPFPNANHRTSIGLARRYLWKEGIDWPPYSLRGRGIDRFIAETDDHIVRSKYLLLLRRRPDLVRVAHAHGFTAVGIKESYGHEIKPGDWDLEEPEVVAKHDAACRALVEDLDGGENVDALADPGRTKLRGFAAPVDEA